MPGPAVPTPGGPPQDLQDLAEAARRDGDRLRFFGAAARRIARGIHLAHHRCWGCAGRQGPRSRK
ncbi:hypothetical protein SSCG_02683 [Streptomyces clavuligerus]|nr:hypothetical protein SSCG_02683 [Streptomyces clavuligerus]